MTSNLKQINSRVTDDEHNGLLELMKQLDMNKAETIRYCIMQECDRRGITIEDTMTKHGQWERD